MRTFYFRFIRLEEVVLHSGRETSKKSKNIQITSLGIIITEAKGPDELRDIIKEWRRKFEPNVFLWGPYDSREEAEKANVF